MKYVKRFLEYFWAFPTFTSKDARLFLNKNGAGEGYYRIFMHNMVKSGRAFDIKKGHYTLHDDPMAAGFVFSPFYYGMETALTYHKLWDYMTPISVITTRRVRTGMLELLGRNVSVRRIQRKNFFGYSMVSYGDFYVPMADIEKTLIDSVYFRARFGKEVYSNAARKISREKLDGYLKRYSGIVRKQVYGIMRRARKAN